MMAKVLDDGDTSDAFPVTNGAKQSIMFAVVLTDTFQDYEDGIPF